MNYENYPTGPKEGRKREQGEQKQIQQVANSQQDE